MLSQSNSSTLWDSGFIQHIQDLFFSLNLTLGNSYSGRFYMFSVEVVSQTCSCMLQLTEKDKISKCAHMGLFWQSTTPCMLPWKKKGVDGRGMVRVRKKASWKQVLSVSLPKAPSRQQTALPSSSLPSAGRGGMQAVVLGQDLGYWESSRGPAGEEYFHQQFTFLCKGPVTAEIISHLLLLNTI